MYLRIRRLRVRVPPSAPRSAALYPLSSRSCGCGHLLCKQVISRLPRSVARISAGAVVALRIATRFLAVRAQAFEQTPEGRLVSRQTCCPVGVSLTSELIDPHLPVAAFEGSTTTEGHFSTPPSQVPGLYSEHARGSRLRRWQSAGRALRPPGPISGVAVAISHSFLTD
jgi:hypothetical protein